LWLWTTRIAARAGTDCDSSQPAAQALNQQVLKFALLTCHLAPYDTLRVEFEDGCPRQMNLKRLGSNAPVRPDLIDCLTRELATQRWSCAADPQACSMVEYDTLP
jgi:hypothetical protein